MAKSIELKHKFLKNKECKIRNKKYKSIKTKPATTYFPDIPVRESIISQDELSFLVRDGARRFLVCIVTGSVKEINYINLLL